MTNETKQEDVRGMVPTDWKEEFETWWNDHGQYVRSGGGQYEKTFAYASFRYFFTERKADCPRCAELQEALDMLNPEEGMRETGELLDKLAALEATASAVQSNVSQVYMEVTGGKCSKENTSASVVIGLFEEYLTARVNEETAALEAENARLKTIERDCEAQHGDLTKVVFELHEAIAAMQIENARLTLQVACDNASYEANKSLIREQETTIAQQSERIRELTERDHAVARTIEDLLHSKHSLKEQLAAAELDAERLRELLSRIYIDPEQKILRISNLILCGSEEASVEEMVLSELDAAIAAQGEKNA